MLQRVRGKVCIFADGSLTWDPQDIMNDTYALKVTLTELCFLESCLKERQAILTDHINLCRNLGLDTTASEASMANVESALTKVNAKLEEVIYG